MTDTPMKMVDGELVPLAGAELADFLDRLENPPAPPVPRSVTPLQMRKAIRVAGLKEQAAAHLATLSEEAQEEWEFCIAVERNNPFIAGAITALGLTIEQADDLFRLAATL